jgi:hypothetical protein
MRRDPVYKVEVRRHVEMAARSPTRQELLSHLVAGRGADHHRAMTGGMLTNSGVEWRNVKFSTRKRASRQLTVYLPAHRAASASACRGAAKEQTPRPTSST